MSEFLITLLARGAILLAFVLMAVCFFRKRLSATTRDFMLRGVMIALLLLPLLWLAPPAWTWNHEWIQDDPTLGALEPLTAAASELSSTTSTIVIPLAISAEALGHATIWSMLGRLLTLLWASAFVAICGHFCIGSWRIRRLERACRLVDDPSWLRAVSNTADGIQLRRKIVVKYGAAVPVPFMAGLFKLRLIIPESALSMTDENRSMMLLHELTHAKRNDIWMRAISRLALALHALNPLAWIAYKILRGTEECAVDDAVLRSGVRPVSYAELLTHFAVACGRVPTGAPAMAQRSTVGLRIQHILDGSRRKEQPGNLLKAMLCISISLLVVFSSGVLAEDQAQDGDPSETVEPPELAAKADKMVFIEMTQVSVSNRATGDDMIDALTHGKKNTGKVAQLLGTYTKPQFEEVLKRVRESDAASVLAKPFVYTTSNGEAKLSITDQEPFIVTPVIGNDGVTIDLTVRVGEDKQNASHSATLYDQMTMALAVEADESQTNVLFATPRLVGTEAHVTPAAPKAIASPSAALKQRKSDTIILDAGHGGHDAGSRRGNMVEKDINLDIVNRTKGALEKRGYNVVLTRKQDPFVSLRRRVEIGANIQNALYVSVHVNWASNKATRGMEAFYCANPQNNQEVGNTSRELAAEILETLEDKFDGIMPGRGLRAAKFWVVRHNPHPSVIVEAGFLSNDQDAALLGDPDFIEKFAVGMAAGIHNFDTER